jgi:hypothetical protein
MTSNECCDDVGWRAYLGTSQRNHDHPPLDSSCVHSSKGFGCKLVAAFFLLGFHLGLGWPVDQSDDFLVLTPDEKLEQPQHVAFSGCRCPPHVYNPLRLDRSEQAFNSLSPWANFRTESCSYRFGERWGLKG